MRKLLPYIVFLIAFSMQSQVKMTPVEANTLKAKVKALSTSTKTITSDFIQYKHLDFLENDIETFGKLAFKAPDLVKWEYSKPYKYSILFKNDKLYINNEGNKSDIDLGSNKMFKQLNQLIISSVKGDMFNDQDFEITYLKDEKGNGLVYFSPKDDKFATFIKAFHLTFNDLGDVIKVKMVEPSGDYTKIVFENKTKNQVLDETIFNN